MVDGGGAFAALRRELLAWPRLGARWASQGWDGRAGALASFFGSSILLGAGFALVDQTQSGSNPFYYYGFGLAFLGIVVLFFTAERAYFRPVWFFGISFLVEIYGWWNVFWTVIDWGKCGGCNLGAQVILANLGSLWPFDHGILAVPLSVFYLTTLAAVAVPLGVADRTPHDVVTGGSA